MSLSTSSPSRRSATSNPPVKTASAASRSPRPAATGPPGAGNGPGHGSRGAAARTRHGPPPPGPPRAAPGRPPGPGPRSAARARRPGPPRRGAAPRQGVGQCLGVPFGGAYGMTCGGVGDGKSAQGGPAGGFGRTGAVRARSQLRTACARSPACHWATPRWYSVSGSGGAVSSRSRQAGETRVGPGSWSGPGALAGSAPVSSRAAHGRCSGPGASSKGVPGRSSAARRTSRAPQAEPVARRSPGGVSATARQASRAAASSSGGRARSRAVPASVVAAAQSGPWAAPGSTWSGPYASSHAVSAPAGSGTCSSWVRARPAWISA